MKKDKGEGEVLPEDWEPSISIGPDPSKKTGKKIIVFIM